MVEKLRNFDDDPLPQDLQEGVDDDEWVCAKSPVKFLVFFKFQDQECRWMLNFGPNKNRISPRVIVELCDFFVFCFGGDGIVTDIRLLAYLLSLISG